MDIGENIRKLRKSRHYTQKHLANLLGVKPTTVASWEQGRNKPLIDKAAKIADIFHVSLTDLIGQDENQIPKNNGLPSNMHYLYQEGQISVRIPIIGTIACGDPITAEQNVDGYTHELFNERPSGTLFALRCKGDSMEPTIPDGAVVIIHQQPDVEDDEVAAVLVDDDTEATLKRVKHTGGQIMLLPENKKYDPILLNKQNPGRILGKVIRVSFDM